MTLYGPKWPLKRGNDDTYETYADLKGQINFYLKNLLLTSPGENLSDPTYGVGLRRFLFEPNLEDARIVIEEEIASKISQYMPYLEVDLISVSATNDQIDNNILSISIQYSIPKRLRTEVFELSMNQVNQIGFY